MQEKNKEVEKKLNIPEATGADPGAKVNSGKKIESEEENNYKKAIQLKESIKCMPTCNEKVNMYKLVAKQFEELSGFEEADQLAEECRQAAKKTNKKLKKEIYEKAGVIKDSAKGAADYKKAAEEFRKVSGFMDADDKALECDQLFSRMQNKEGNRSIVRIALILLCIAALLVGASTSHGKYYTANAFMMTGSYKTAIKIYSKMGPYKDCVARLTECRYKQGLKYEADKDYDNARKLFKAAGNYKDSDTRKVRMEISIIKNSMPGDKVTVGLYRWRVLAVGKDKALLLKKNSIPNQQYNNTVAASTWETSSIRSWLNKDFMNDAFTKAEQENILLTNVDNGINSVYGTKGGNNTQDSCFLLSIDEAKQYSSILQKVKSNSWLRSPGSNINSAAFLTLKGAVMSYGYDVTNREFGVLPAFWFKLD